MADDPEIQRELALLKEHMFGMFHMWTMLEDSLAMLTQLTMMRGYGKEEAKSYGLAIYFATTSAQGRFAIVDAIINQFFHGEPHEQEALSAWGQLLARLHKVREKRNKVAHGTVSAPTYRGKQYAVISGPMFELEKKRPVADKPRGMSLDELKATLALCARCMANIGALQNIIQATKLKHHDGATLQGICRTLKEHLMSESDRIFVPNPPLFPIQPEPSEG